MTAEEYLKTKVINFESLSETLEFTVYSLTKLMEDYHEAELKKLRVGDVIGSVCKKCGADFMPRLFKELTICDRCHDAFLAK
tara:strand:- start:1222 stop:1467 length:246 start_codon:yes stop_codon:yes gene_type:complete